MISVDWFFFSIGIILVLVSIYSYFLIFEGKFSRMGLLDKTRIIMALLAGIFFMLISLFWIKLIEYFQIQHSWQHDPEKPYLVNINKTKGVSVILKLINKYSEELFVIWRILFFIATLGCFAVAILLIHNSDKLKVWIAIITALSLAWSNYKVFMWFKKLHEKDAEFDHPSWIRGCLLSSMCVLIAVIDFLYAYIF